MVGERATVESQRGGDDNDQRKLRTQSRGRLTQSSRCRGRGGDDDDDQRKIDAELKVPRERWRWWRRRPEEDRRGTGGAAGEVAATTMSRGRSTRS
jgi:hypothetical protein